MKADLPLAERRRIEREETADLRDSLVRSHFEVMEGGQALAGGLLLADLQMAAALKVHQACPKPIAPAVPVPVIEPEAPAPGTDLRAQLGLT